MGRAGVVIEMNYFRILCGCEENAIQLLLALAYTSEEICSIAIYHTTVKLAAKIVAIVNISTANHC